MSNEPDLRVPPRYVPALRTLAAATAEAYESLLKSLDTQRSGYSKAALQSQVEQALGEQRDSAGDLVDVLLALHGVRRAFGLDAAAVARSVARSEPFAAQSEANDLAARLTSVLSCWAITLVARAQSLLSEYDRSFLDARILSDIRPVFDQRDDQQVDGAVVVHSLRLRFSEEQAKSAVYAMTTADLRTLQRQVDRAITKAQRLEELVRAIPLPFIELEPQPEEPDGS